MDPEALTDNREPAKIGVGEQSWRIPGVTDHLGIIVCINSR